ncbi:uncharacterized protein [Lepeophtheirus salmonis]|uniref:Phosphatidylinositol-4-phosphate 5-kinase 8 n=1 Tax=Lepeophtheirus salmonis TaxID=72036 RepID=C1BUI7_LEPSM|nr:Phosphatidylinositol-4-phosphate 5-kinase 8 [Lepeophtheirus salmonis]
MKLCQNQLLTVVVFVFVTKVINPVRGQRRTDVFKTELFLNDGDLNSGLYEGMVRGRRLFGSSQIPHGIGTINYFTSDIFGRKNYTGNWKDGMRSGFGTTYFRDSSVYKGQYKDGVENGDGTIVYNNGNTLRGEFKDGKIHGHVVFNYPNGDQREGFFDNNILNGQVIYTKANGDTKIEIWAEGVRQNEGAVTRPSASSRRVIPTTPKTVIIESNNLEDFNPSFTSSNSIDNGQIFTKSIADERGEPFRLPRLESTTDGSNRRINLLMESLRRIVKEEQRNFLLALFQDVS